ncbi:hypothetical protein PR202_ga28392 [Eleusine coracana subsp. coracana]|uniref:Protein FAR1-RELATED SEQUENCE n=1 Tax=Eleusine coracana subsp. coracana TaxID=191504 RepID=A0AAV5DIZ0_ELECO|nr:hypothetical protein PR202_ga28392 [Eleusine coracana subsp. coracana]
MVQENNADTQTVVDEDEFVIEEVGTDSDDQAADKGAGLIEPRKDMIFHSENDAVAFYRRYAQKKGFTITRRSSKIEDEKVRYFTLACSRQGKAQYNPKNKWKPKTSSRVQCPAKINFCIHDPDNKFRVTSLTLEHNHDLCPTEKKIIVSQKKPDQGAKRNRRASNGRSEVHANKKLSSTPVQTRSLVLLGDYGNHQFGDNDTQECECDNAFIDVYVKSGITLNQFLEHYNNVLRDMVEKENDADLKSCQEMTPCITHYDIEKRFQLVYTNKKFEEFQEQVKVAEKAATSDELFNLVVEGLRELKVKVDAQLAAHDNQNQKDNPVEHQDVEMQ